MSRLSSLAEAVERHVRPGMHLHFASTPSRSNASIREVGRQFRGTSPAFCLSATGFHSSAHLLGLLRLGRRYIGCFFGDNYPTPRPNSLYQELEREGALLEHWSLLTFVQALRAAALGQKYAVTRSLAGTSLGERLAKDGRFYEVPDPRDPEQRLGMVAALTPDIAFLHAPAGAASGRAVFSPPFSEGFYGALAAKTGVILTVDKLLSEETLDEVAHLVPLPTRRVLAIVEEPFGAHPQPSHFAPNFPELSSYGDDFVHYERWRRMPKTPELFEAFGKKVLEAEDGGEGYRAYVGQDWLEALRAPPRRASGFRRAQSENAKPRRALGAPLAPGERLVLLGGRTIARRIREERHKSVLAGIGQSFAAARLGLLMLRASGEEVELMIETGIAGLDPWDANPFLLSQENAAAARRLSSVEGELGLLACGGAAECLAVIGCAEVDATGSVNSSVASGRLLVGSGGANDLASSAGEVVVLSRLERLVPKVEFVTSRGCMVRAIVTEEAVIERDSPEGLWKLRAFGLGTLSLSELLARLPFEVKAPEAIELAPPASEAELLWLERVVPDFVSATDTEARSSHA